MKHTKGLSGKIAKVRRCFAGNKSNPILESKPIMGLEPYQSSVIPLTKTVFHATVSLRSFYTCLCSSYAKKSNNEYWFSETSGTSAYTLFNIWSWILSEKSHALCMLCGAKLQLPKPNTSFESNIAFLHVHTFVAQGTFSSILEKGKKGREEDIPSINTHEESEKQRKMWVAAVLQKVQSRNTHICRRMLSSAVAQTQSIIFFPNTGQQ